MNELFPAAATERGFFGNFGWERSRSQRDCWKVLIASNNAEICSAVRLALSDVIFDGCPITFLEGRSLEEAREIVRSREDLALAIVDIDLDAREAGLSLAREIREKFENPFTRMFLCADRPEMELENRIVRDCDINDCLLQKELLDRQFVISAIAALRAFRALVKLEESHARLRQIVSASARFVPHEFFDALGKEGVLNVELGNSVLANMTVLFSNIRSFTQLSDRMSAKEKFDFINEYLHRVSPTIRRNRGFVDKYIGDAIMALFPQKSSSAVLAAIEMHRQVQRFNRERGSCEPISIGIGLHTGSLMLGIVGEKQRMQSTVISDDVNLASRMEELTKIYQASIVMSSQTLRYLDSPHQYQFRFLDRVRVKGKQAPVAVFELYECDEETNRRLKQETQLSFEEGVFLYYQQRYLEAQKIFESIYRTNPFDRAAYLYVERCKVSRKTGIPLNLEGFDEIGIA